MTSGNLAVTLPYQAITQTSSETEALGGCLSRALAERGNILVAMFGPMGAGKTAFARGFFRALFPLAAVSSPTYAIVNEYRDDLFHYDMYRVDNPDALTSCGYFDMLASPHIALVEWAENITSHLPKSYIKVEITPIGGDQRMLKISEIL